jgi:hypothetical protein
MFSAYEITENINSKYIDRLGSFFVGNYELEYKPQIDKNIESLRELKFHNCTTDDINKFGQTA